MAFLRSSLLLTLVCLFVLTGYSAQAFGVCCERGDGEPAQHAEAASTKQLPADTHDCQCVCHQILADSTHKPLHVIGASILSVESLTCGNQYPPDALPLGIDYPPQLG